MALGLMVRGERNMGAPVEQKAERQAIVSGMHCPFCQNPDTKVIDTRISDDGHSIRRAG